MVRGGYHGHKLRCPDALKMFSLSTLNPGGQSMNRKSYSPSSCFDDRFCSGSVAFHLQHDIETSARIIRGTTSSNSNRTRDGVLQVSVLVISFDAGMNLLVSFIVGDEEEPAGRYPIKCPEPSAAS